MRRRITHAPQPTGKINVTPLIDVVMCLIIFYLIVGKLAEDKKALVKLPETARGAAQTRSADLTITVGPGGAAAALSTLRVDGREVTGTELETVVRDRLAAKADLSVQVRADRSLTYSQVSPALEACRRAGLASVRLATERQP